ncbi:MAG: YgiT-type zinc finger protein [Methylococcaceae bacterium]|nr:YgiT-type zinc finger protein [Methylococcaceae bacterium]
MSKCEVCGGREFRCNEVEEVFHVDGRYVLVEHIPATVCVQCGEKTFDAATAESIRQMLHDRRRPTRSVAMEVLAF